jgi:hypothetical protein
MGMCEVFLMDIVGSKILKSNGQRVVLWRWDDQFNTSEGGVAYSTVGSVFDEKKSIVSTFKDDEKPGMAYKALMPLA